MDNFTKEFDTTGIEENIKNSKNKLEATARVIQDKDNITSIGEKAQKITQKLQDQVNGKAAGSESTSTAESTPTPEPFTTISLINQHPSLRNRNRSTNNKTNQSEIQIPLSETVSFSPHFENASIMKLIIIAVIVLCLTQLFITYRGHIYNTVHKLYSNKVVKTTFRYIF